MKYKKKTLALLLALLLLLLAAVGGTFAYFSREARATNVITTGTVEMALFEKQLVDGEETDYPGGPITGVMPASTVSKIPYIRNVGTASFYTRVKVAVTITGADGQPLPTEAADGVPVLRFDIGEDWVYSDGWYYYEKPLNPADPAAEGAVGDTVKLFSTVTFSKNMGNEYQGCAVQIDVSAQAVQVKNNVMTGGDVTTIKGWPAEKAE